VRSDIGAIAVGRWHSTQLLNKIGATSLENVGAPAANAGAASADTVTAIRRAFISSPVRSG
jgi:hypothetical protein